MIFGWDTETVRWVGYSISALGGIIFVASWVALFRTTRRRNREW